MFSRNFSHLSLSYLLRRSVLFIDNKVYPHDPWLTRASINILKSVLRPTDRGIEFGSGRSTKWFLQRVESLQSIETDGAWFEKVGNECQKFIQQGKLKYAFLNSESEQNEYIKRIPNCSLDFSIIDGFWRDTCALNIVPKVKPGGVIVLDNINLYLPCDVSVSPCSRRISDGFASPVWEDFSKLVSDFRYIWTSNGVTDTGIWFK